MGWINNFYSKILEIILLKRTRILNRYRGIPTHCLFIHWCYYYSVTISGKFGLHGKHEWYVNRQEKIKSLHSQNIVRCWSMIQHMEEPLEKCDHHMTWEKLISIKITKYHIIQVEMYFLYKWQEESIRIFEYNTVSIGVFVWRSFFRFKMFSTSVLPRRLGIFNAIYKWKNNYH